MMCGGAAPDHHGHHPWVEMELLAPSQCVARRFERGDEGVSASEVEGFFIVNEISFFWKGETRS